MVLRVGVSHLLVSSWPVWVAAGEGWGHHFFSEDTTPLITTCSRQAARPEAPAQPGACLHIPKLSRLPGVVGRNPTAPTRGPASALSSPTTIAHFSLACSSLGNSLLSWLGPGPRAQGTPILNGVMCMGPTEDGHFIWDGLPEVVTSGPHLRKDEDSHRSICVLLLEYCFIFSPSQLRHYLTV